MNQVAVACTNTRTYTYTQVVLDYAVDTKIDIWSLGCILSELYTGDVLFQNDSVQTMLARMVGVKGKLARTAMELHHSLGGWRSAGAHACLCMYICTCSARWLP